MRPKPTPKKRDLPILDTHKGYLIECYGRWWHAFDIERGGELWDCGFATREELIATIDGL